MRNFVIRLQLVVVVLAGQAYSQSAEFDRIVKEAMARERIPGVVYAVSKDGEIVHSGAFGTADLRHGVPMKMNTVFDLASITKQFIGTAVLVLEQDGKLTLEDPISGYIPDCPSFCDGVTIKHLLTHTSGLPGIDDNWRMMEEEWGERMEYSDDHWLAVFRKGGLRNEPGKLWDYSDIGYYVVGLIVARASGMSTADFLKKRIFAPAGMKETYTEDEDQIIPNEAEGYLLRDDKLLSNRRDWDRATIGSGGVFSTVGDLVKWDRALANSTVLTEESTRKLFSFTRLNNGAESNYALGWYVNEIFGVKVQYHTGSTGPEIIRIPEKGLFVAVLSNLDGVGAGAAEMAGLLVPELRRGWNKFGTGAISRPDAWTGDYISQSGRPSTIRLENGKLILRFSEEFQDELIRAGYDQFVSKEIPDVHYRFERDERGRIIRYYMVNHWYYNFPQTRVADDR